jgi:transcriptional/translational regulatory protein YebC/TACO1
MYDRRGKVEVNAKLDEEQLLEAAIEAGCEDMELVSVRKNVHVMVGLIEWRSSYL